LSATPRRLDGAQDVFFYHVSDITYDAKIKAMTPGIRILRTVANLKPIARGQYRVDVSDLNSAQILTQLGEDRLRSKDIVDQILLAVKAGRKVMVVSERIQHLKMMGDMLNDSFFSLQLPFRPTVDYYTGEWFSGKFWEKASKTHRVGDPKMAKRSEEDLKKAESANVIMATSQMVSEGLDIQALDVLVLSTPKSDVEQAVGRVRRWCNPEPAKCKRLCPWRAGVCEGKPDPIVVDVVDERISVLVGKWNRRRAFYKTIGAEV
jgi:superfamily II DNA or RNA helicase